MAKKIDEKLVPGKNLHQAEEFCFVEIISLQESKKKAKQTSEFAQIHKM